MTQEKIIEQHLIERKKITTIEAFMLYQITCLNKMIHLLRKKYFIESVWKTKNNKRYVEYNLEGEK